MYTFLRADVRTGTRTGSFICNCMLIINDAFVCVHIAFPVGVVVVAREVQVGAETGHLPAVARRAAAGEYSSPAWGSPREGVYPFLYLKYAAKFN